MGGLGGSRRTRDITDRTPEISQPPRPGPPCRPRPPPSDDHLEGRLFGGGKAPERRLRVATDITVTHTRSRSRILSGISSESNRRRCRDAVGTVEGTGTERADGGCAKGDLGEGAVGLRERDGEISFLGY